MSQRIPSNYQISFNQSIAASTEATYEEKVPYNSIIESVLLEFPPGCNGLVEVECKINGGRFLPMQGEPIALNSQNYNSPLGIIIRQKDRLQVVWGNYDDTNAHKVPVIFNLRVMSEQEIQKYITRHDVTPNPVIQVTE